MLEHDFQKHRLVSVFPIEGLFCFILHGLTMILTKDSIWGWKIMKEKIGNQFNSVPPHWTPNDNIRSQISNAVEKFMQTRTTVNTLSSYQCRNPPRVNMLIRVKQSPMSNSCRSLNTLVEHTIQVENDINPFRIVPRMPNHKQSCNSLSRNVQIYLLNNRKKTDEVTWRNVDPETCAEIGLIDCKRTITDTDSRMSLLSEVLMAVGRWTVSIKLDWWNKTNVLKKLNFIQIMKYFTHIYISSKGTLMCVHDLKENGCSIYKTPHHFALTTATPRWDISGSILSIHMIWIRN